MSDESLLGRFNDGAMDRRTFIKVASILGGAAVLGLPLLGCQQAAAPAQKQEVKLAVPSAMLPLADIYAGNGANIFGQVGINNALTEFSGGAEQIRGMLTGGYLLATISPTAGMSAAEGGEPVRFVAGGYLNSTVGFMVKPDSPFKKPEDLKGTKFKIGYSRPNSNSHMMAYLALKAIGIDPNDNNQVEFVSTGGIPDTWTAVKTGLVDVGWCEEPTISNLEAKNEGRLLWTSGDFVKGWMSTSQLTSQSYIDSNAKEIQTWVSAYIKAQDWLKNNYSEGAKYLGQALGVDASIAETALKKAPKEAWSASMPKQTMELMANVAIQFKQLKAMPDWKTLINQDFLPSNLRDTTY